MGCEVSDGLETVQDLPQETISGIPLSSSPIEEDGGLEESCELWKLQDGRVRRQLLATPIQCRLDWLL